MLVREDRRLCQQHIHLDVGVESRRRCWSPRCGGRRERFGSMGQRSDRHFRRLQGPQDSWGRKECRGQSFLKGSVISRRRAKGTKIYVDRGRKQRGLGVKDQMDVDAFRAEGSEECWWWW